MTLCRRRRCLFIKVPNEDEHDDDGADDNDDYDVWQY